MNRPRAEMGVVQWRLGEKVEETVNAGGAGV